MLKTHKTDLSLEERHQIRKKIQQDLNFSDSDVDYETDDCDVTEPVAEEKNKDTEVYSVERVLDHTVLRGKTMYKVKWRGYSLDETTWEPVSNFISKGSRLAIYQYHERELLKKKLLESDGIKIEKENHGFSKIPHHKLADDFGDVKKPKIAPKIDVKALSRDSSSKNSYPAKEKIRKVPIACPEIKAHPVHSIASSSKSGNDFKRSHTGKTSEFKPTKFSSSYLTKKSKFEVYKNASEMRRREEEKQRQEAEMEDKLRMKREKELRRQEIERKEQQRALLKAQKLAEKEKREAEERRRKAEEDAEIERRRLQFIKDLCGSDSEET